MGMHLVPRWLLAVVMAATVSAGSLSATAATRPATSTSAQPHVVIAVIEEAINVYHHDFAAPALTSSPAERLPGYPRTSTPLRLHLHERDYAAARRLDDATWAGLKPNQLYFLPGTRFAGLIYMPNALDKATGQFNIEFPPPENPPRPVIDGYSYHGTGVASVAAGTTYGTCPDCDIVVVAADNPEDGLQWAARQPWIDVISNSWGGPWGVEVQASAGHPERATATGASEGSALGASSGKAVVFASGNGVTDLGPTTHGTQHALTWHSPFAGPPWVLAVGASKAGTGQPTDWHNIPVDVISQGEDRPAAGSNSLTGTETFMGTSCAAPITAGVLAEALFRARKATADAHVGAVRGSLLSPSQRIPRGPAADGRLTYAELFDAARSVARWQPFDPSSVSKDPIQAFATPTTPIAYAYEGWGLLDRVTVAPLTQVLLGEAAAPARPEMQQWAGVNAAARSSRWGSQPSPR